MTDLLPCPFCGGNAEISKDTIGWYFVRCKTHLCYGENAVMRFINEEQAAIAWNTRAERTCHNLLGAGVFHCSECDMATEDWFDIGGEPAYGYNYCPNCGAKVEEQ